MSCPNAIGPALVQASVLMGFALQIEAALSFLGLGAQPPTPSLGLMLADGRDVLTQAPWVEIFPGLAIAITVARVQPRRRRPARTPRPARGSRDDRAPAQLDRRRRATSGDGPGGVSAVTDVSLEIAEGEIFGLVGESGCGKTTLALAMMGLLPANRRRARRDPVPGARPGRSARRGACGACAATASAWSSRTR